MPNTRIDSRELGSTLDQMLALRPASRRAARDGGPGKFALFRMNAADDHLADIGRLLARRFTPCLRTIHAPIPPGCITEMRRNYQERLPKTMRLKSANLDSPSGAARRIARSMGLIDLLTSDRLRRFAEDVTAQRLLPDPGCQLLRYDAGDYSGPHNDHHPEQAHLRDGYVDLHIMISEPSVMSQYLVYEKQPGLLNEVEDIGRGLAVAVYQLPFWHYTTPLLPKQGLRNARRWLLLASYIIDRPAKTRR